MTDRISTDALRGLLANVTPGPWAYEAHGDTMTYGVGVCHEISDIEMAFPLSGQVNSDVMVVEPVCPEVSGQSNARLIAAAPDLAAEVIELREALEEIAKQAAQADDPEHHTLGLIKNIAHAALNHKETE